MAVVLTLSSASSNLPSFLANWSSGFSYNGHGWFNGIFGGGDEWVAGNYTTPPTAPNGQSSVIMSMDDYSYSPGDFEGTVTELALGTDLFHNITSDTFQQTTQLSITADVGDYLPDSAIFQEAIYALSHGGDLDGGTFQVAPGVFVPMRGLYDYFAEQGTVQVGNVGLNDTLVGFGGADTFVFQDGSGADIVNSFDVAEDFLDVSAWGATSLSDLFIGVVGSDTLIFSADVSDSITVAGVTNLTASNFIFDTSLAAAA